jgi:hypothetical protein
VQQIAGQDQVAGGGNGKEFGEAFDKAQYQRLEQRVEIHGRGTIGLSNRPASLAC